MMAIQCSTEGFAAVSPRQALGVGHSLGYAGGPVEVDLGSWVDRSRLTWGVGLTGRGYNLGSWVDHPYGLDAELRIINRSHHGPQTARAAR